MVSDPDDKWCPEYVTIFKKGDGDLEILVPIQDRRFSECPVSALSRGIGPSIYQATLSILHAQSVHESTGIYPGGPDPYKWPAKWLDFVLLANSERDLVKQEREEAAENLVRLP